MIGSVFAHSIALAFAALFAFAARHKLKAPRSFIATLSNYALLPRWLVPVVAVGLIAVEVLLVPMVLLPSTLRVGLLAAGALLAIYAVAMASSLARGRNDFDCGCGFAAQRGLSWWQVVRNGALVATAASAHRSLSNSTWPGVTDVAHWAAVVALAAAAVMIYAIAEQLAENRIQFNAWLNGHDGD